MTAPEAAERLNVSVRTVYSWIQTGHLPAVRLSPRCTRIPSDAVESLIKSSSAPADPPIVRPDISMLIWDVDPDRIDEDRDAAFLIARILMAGRPPQVAWMFRRYPREQIERVVRHDRGLPPRVSDAWRNLLGMAPGGNDA